MMEHQSRSKRAPWVLLTVLLVVAAIAGVVALRNQQDSLVAHELIQHDEGSELKAESLDVPDELKFEGNLEEVSKQVGEKESTMADAEVLSDGAVEDSVQVEMDKLDADKETDPVLMDEKEDGEEEANTDDADSDSDSDSDANLDFLSDEEAAKVAVEEDRYPRPQCRRLRRCYRKFCSKRKCKRVCRRRRICSRRRYGRRVYTKCVVRPYCYTHCSVCRSQCGVYCRLFTHCRRVPRVRCYNRYCVRRFCQRRCVAKGRKCGIYRRCYRRCVGVCGRKNRRCYHRCYRYRRCRVLNRCFTRCFRRRAVCGRRCVHTGRRPCRGNRNGVTYVKNKIVGCSGAFTGGVFGAQAKNLCNRRGGWAICRNAVQVRRLGLTRQVCAAKSPANTFFATQQQSTGHALCNNRGFNDVFGCGKGRLFAQPNLRSCTPFNKFVGSWTNPASGWNCKGCNGYHEARLFRKGPRNGGVLCCKVR